MTNQNAIYLDQEGYTKHLTAIKNLEQNLAKINEEIGSLVIAKEQLNEYNELIILRNNVEETIDLMKTKTKNIIIVEKENDENILDINDTVKVNIIFSETEQDECIFTLVGQNDIYSYEKVSINSPIGKALYKAKVGDEVFYNLKDEKIKVKILEKINVKKLVK